MLLAPHPFPVRGESTDVTIADRLVHRARLTAACVLVVVATVALVGRPAGADDGPIAPAPPNSGQFLESWALAPTGTDPSQPSSRPNLSYTVDPGAVVDDSVSLWNYGDTQMTFHVYATDAFTNSTGEFTLLPDGGKPKNTGTWVTLQQDAVTVPARTRIDIPIQVHVPKDASPGDHTAGIVAAAATGTTNGSGQSAVVVRRTGSRVYIRVNGPVNPSIVVENLSTDYHGSFNPLDGDLEVNYTLRNAGNVRLGALQRVEVTDLFGRTIDARRGKPIQEILPGNVVQVHQMFSGVPAEFRLGASVRVTPMAPRDVNGAAPPPATYGSHAWAIPWTVLLLIALAFLLWRLYRRYRDSREDVPPTVGNTGTGLPGNGPSGAPRAPEHVLQLRRMPGGAGA
jgi:hypothetical protein